MEANNLTKDKLTLSNIKQDLDKVAYVGISNVDEWRSAYYVPITMIAIIVGVLLKSVWIGILIFSVAAYHIVMYVMAHNKYCAQRKTVKDILDRGDISISVEKLSSISEETIYEPHMHHGFHRAHSDSLKEVTFFYFESGVRWRVPDCQHYEWSAECYLSSTGLKNISVEGNEFFFVTLQGHSEVAYVYPSKLFELDEVLKQNNSH